MKASVIYCVPALFPGPGDKVMNGNVLALTVLIVKSHKLLVQLVNMNNSITNSRAPFLSLK